MSRGKSRQRTTSSWGTDRRSPGALFNAVVTCYRVVSRATWRACVPGVPAGFS